MNNNNPAPGGQKTHWKKIANSNYLGEADFQVINGAPQDMVLTIAGVNQSEKVVTAEGKSEKAVVHWQEPGAKPMILNVAKAKSIAKVAGSPYMEDWPGTKVQLFVQGGIKAFGEVVSAVRVRPFKPRLQQTPPSALPVCTDCKRTVTGRNNATPEQVAQYAMQRFGRCLCADCIDRASQGGVK